MGRLQVSKGDKKSEMRLQKWMRYGSYLTNCDECINTDSDYLFIYSMVIHRAAERGLTCGSRRWAAAAQPCPQRWGSGRWRRRRGTARWLLGVWGAVHTHIKCGTTQNLYDRDCKSELDRPAQRKEPGRLVHCWLGGQAELCSSHSLTSATPNGRKHDSDRCCGSASIISLVSFKHLDTSEGRNSTAGCCDRRWGTRIPAAGSRWDTGTAAGSRRTASGRAGSWGPVRTLGLGRKLWRHDDECCQLSFKRK